MMQGSRLRISAPPRPCPAPRADWATSTAFDSVDFLAVMGGMHLCYPGNKNASSPWETARFSMWTMGGSS